MYGFSFKKSISIVAFLLLLFSAKPQIPSSAFSFGYTKDTTISCSQNCITLATRIADIRESSGYYVVNRLDNFRQEIIPGSSGTSLSLLMDDSYSSEVILPFDFPFFGIAFSSLAVSGNGYISFDANNAEGASHWQLFETAGNLSGGTGTSSTPANLPNELYDRAVIMAPYHDLDATYTTSPDMSIRYNLTGVAPHRKWILTYYKVPLYSVSCMNLIDNTQQVILYEGTGIVDVLVKSIQSCPTWNRGRALIGMQNYDRNTGIMAPGRSASDSGWNAVNLNESWRFTPSEGVSLFKRVELYKITGELVATGDTLNAGSGIFNVQFSNVCLDSSTTYLVKSVYKGMLDSTVEIYGADTINVIKPTGANASQSVWTGAIDSAWENPLNWSCGNLPTSTSNVIISQGTVVINSNVIINSAIIQPGVHLTVNPGFNFTILNPH